MMTYTFFVCVFTVLGLVTTKCHFECAIFHMCYRNINRFKIGDRQIKSVGIIMTEKCIT